MNARGRQCTASALHPGNGGLGGASYGGGTRLRLIALTSLQHSFWSIILNHASLLPYRRVAERIPQVLTPELVVPYMPHSVKALLVC
jgi:hypothetical protein